MYEEVDKKASYHLIQCQWDLSFCHFLYGVFCIQRDMAMDLTTSSCICDTLAHVLPRIYPPTAKLLALPERGELAIRIQMTRDRAHWTLIGETRVAENATQIHLSLCSKLFHDLEGEGKEGVEEEPRRESGEFFRGGFGVVWRKKHTSGDKSKR